MCCWTGWQLPWQPFPSFICCSWKATRVPCILSGCVSTWANGPGPFLAGVAGFLLRIAGQFFPGGFGTLLWRGGDVIFTGMMLAFGIMALKNQKKAKKPLRYTARVKRLLVPVFLLALVGPAARLLLQASYVRLLFNGIQPWGGWWDYGFWPELVRFLPGLLLPLVVCLAHVLTWPVEKLVQGWYMGDARKRLLANPALIRIGITGSFGKTSTKYALGTILGEKYKTLYTPGSFNTPMGVTRTIREKLTPEHQVFIGEMGARYKGDVAQLCRLVRPQYGILTAIGKQHLETFGSLENVMRAKGELLAGVGSQGCVFLNGDDPLCRQLYENSPLQEKYLFGTQGEGLYMRAEDITVGPEGSRFTLVCQDGTRIPCVTRLLGRHNILNVAGAAALAYKLGLSEAQIAAGIGKLEPVEHRLQLLPGPITVIDDAFNANPVGLQRSAGGIEVLPRPTDHHYPRYGGTGGGAGGLEPGLWLAHGVLRGRGYPGGTQRPGHQGGAPGRRLPRGPAGGGGIPGPGHGKAAAVSTARVYGTV